MLALRQGTYLAKPSELNRLAIFYLVNIVTWVFLIESAFLLVRRVNKRTAH
jgi:hypothetical protein